MSVITAVAAPSATAFTSSVASWQNASVAWLRTAPRNRARAAGSRTNTAMVTTISGAKGNRLPAIERDWKAFILGGVRSAVNRTGPDTLTPERWERVSWLGRVAQLVTR